MRFNELLHDLEETHNYVKVILNCHLYGTKYYYTPGTIVTAEIYKVSSKNHVLSIDNERFGVYHNYYKELIDYEEDDD